jgi:hypothetical protein
MTKNMKRILVLLASAGVIAVVVGGSTGTFASFSAEVQNNNNTFVTGTMFLHNTANGGNLCTSESASSNSNTGINGDTCSTNFTIANHGGAQDTSYYTLVLKNAGTINASSLKFYASSACNPSTVGIVDGVVSGTQTGADITLDGSGTYAIPGGATVSVGTQTGLTTTAAVTAVGATTLHLTGSITATDADVVKYFPAIGGSAGDLCTAVKLSVYDMGSNAGDTNPAHGTCVYPASCTPVTGGTTLASLPATATAFTIPEGLNAAQTRNLLIEVSNGDLGNSYQSQQAAVSLGWHIDE